MKHVQLYLLLIATNQIWAQDTAVTELEKTNTPISAINSTEDKIPIKIVTEYDSLMHSVLPNTGGTQDLRVELISSQPDPGHSRTVLALISVLFGVLLKEVIDRLNSRRKLLKQGERWTAEFQALSIPLVKQVEALEKFKVDHAIDKWTPERLVLIQDLDGSTFDSLDKNDLTQYLKKNCVKSPKLEHAIELSNSVTGFVTVMKSIQTDTIKYWDSYQDGVSGYSKSFDMSFKRFRDAYRKYSVEIETEPGPEVIVIPYENSAIEVIGQYYKQQIIRPEVDSDSNPYTVNRGFYQPALLLFAALRRDTRTHPMVQAIVDGQDVLKGLERESQYIDRNIDNLILRYNEQIEKHRILVEKIKTKA